MMLEFLLIFFAKLKSLNANVLHAVSFVVHFNLLVIGCNVKA